MSNYDNYLTRETNAYLDAMDSLDDEYESAEATILDNMRELKDGQKYGTYDGCDFCGENLYLIQPQLLRAIAHGNDKEILKLVYDAFEKELSSLVKYKVENQ
jgi:hypothetical protein